MHKILDRNPLERSSERAPTTKKRTSAAEKAENRSLKSRFTGIFASQGFDFGGHLPGGRETPFGPDTVPEFQIEGSVVPGWMAEDPNHADRVVVGFSPRHRFLFYRMP
jgi:hypothetical protein